MPGDSLSQPLAVGGIDSLRPCLMGARHTAVAGHYGAAHAAFTVLEAGGNAVDAGVAAGIALGVLQSDLVNVAGVAPILIYRAQQRDVLTISGLGTWPRAVTTDLFREHHGDRIPDGLLRTVGPGRARRLDHGFRTLRHDELRRLRASGDPLRERRPPDVRADGGPMPGVQRGRPVGSASRRPLRECPQMKGQGQNRTGEIPPSGIVGGLAET